MYQYFCKVVRASVQHIGDAEMRVSHQVRASRLLLPVPLLPVKLLPVPLLLYLLTPCHVLTPFPSLSTPPRSTSARWCTR